MTDTNYSYHISEIILLARHDPRNIIKIASSQNNFPPLLLAGVCWIEVAGDPQFIDNLAHNIRSFDWSGPPFVDRKLTPVLFKVLCSWQVCLWLIDMQRCMRGCVPLRLFLNDGVYELDLPCFNGETF